MESLPNLHSSDSVITEIDLAKELEAKMEKERLWREQRMGKFTSSQAYRLMNGADETEEEAIENLAKSKEWKLEELKEHCELHGISTEGMKLKKDYAKALIYKGIILYGVNKWPEGAETYVTEKLIEELTGEPFNEDFISRDMQWGKDHEVEAMERLAIEKNLDIEAFGDDQEFIDANHKGFDKYIPDHIRQLLGCTPDGKVIQEPKGVETKCPKKMTHFKYKMGIYTAEDLKEEYTEAYWQCHCTMYITGWDEMFFMSYDPRYKNPLDQCLIIEVKRNKQDISNLEERLLMAAERYEELKQKWIETRK